MTSGKRASRDGRVARALSAYNARSWSEAYDAFTKADADGMLDPSDLELFAMTAFMLGRVREMIETQERAYHTYLERDEPLRAARAALWLATNLAARGKFPQASGWIEVSERILKTAPEDCVERGYALMPQALRRITAGDYEGVADFGERAADIGRRFGDHDLAALAAQTQARALLKLSRTDEGLRLLDEVMVSVTGSELSPMVTGLVYCSVLEGCYETHAFSRAAVWTQSLSDWCGEQPDLVAFNDQCLAHRAETLRLQGAWSDAVVEAERAGGAGARFAIAAQAHYQLGEVQRMRGELAAADTTYKAVSLDGGESLPGAALLKLAQGETDDAYSSLAEALAATTDAFDRIQLLPTFVEVAVAADKVSEASDASKELAGIAMATGTAAHIGWAEHAKGRVALAESRTTQAVVHLKKAKQVWQSISLPYELARSRVDLARALMAKGDTESAELECAAARSLFEDLGASPDVRAIDDLMRGGRMDRPGGLTDREAEVLKMVASGATNRSIAADLVVSERTVDRHVSNIFTKIDVSTRSAATAWAIRNGLA